MQQKKSLGQNFLKSKGAIAKMVAVSGAQKGKLVLEIGPGLGVLTETLLATGANVVAVEKDDRLIPVLRESSGREIADGQLILIRGDILDSATALGECGVPPTPSELASKFKLVANIPYYITGQVIRKFLEAENQPSSMTLLVQKEVAERIVAKDEKESLLSLSVKVFGTPKYVQTVKRGSFEPAPKVDSAILHIGNISRPGADVAKFFKLIHAGFAHKRKQLLPNLATLHSKSVIADAFEKCEIDPKARAEDLPLQKWFELCQILPEI